MVHDHFAQRNRGGLCREVTASSTQVHDVDVGTQPHVVGEVPAVVVRVFVDHNLIAVPEPVTAVTHVERCDIEIETSKPEPARTASN